MRLAARGAINDAESGAQGTRIQPKDPAGKRRRSHCRWPGFQRWIKRPP
jgi:hypothetical protein